MPLDNRCERVRLRVPVLVPRGTGVGDHGDAELLAGVQDGGHARVVRGEPLEHRVELDPASTSLHGPAEMRGPCGSGQHARIGGDEHRKIAALAGDLQGPGIEVHQAPFQLLPVVVDRPASSGQSRGAITRLGPLPLQFRELEVGHEHVHDDEVVAVRGTHGCGRLLERAGQLQDLDVGLGPVLPDLVGITLWIAELGSRDEVHVRVDDGRVGHRSPPFWFSAGLTSPHRRWD